MPLTPRMHFFGGVAERGIRPMQEPHFPGDGEGIIIERADFPGMKPSARHRPIAKGYLVNVPSGYALIHSQWSKADPLWLPFNVAIAPQISTRHSTICWMIFLLTIYIH